MSEPETNSIVTEIYKPLVGFDNYMISNNGSLINGATGKMLKLRLDKDGYLRTNIYKEGKSVTVRIHRLVAEAFIENPDNKRLVDHIDRNLNNNNVTNLRWANHSENSMNGKVSTRNASGYKCISYITSRNKYQLVMVIDGKNKFIGYFNTPEEALAKWNEMAPECYKEFQPIGVNVQPETL